MSIKKNTIKILCVSFLLFSPLFSASQKSVIFKNVNVLAKELSHKLNKTGDSLVLNGERNISKVEVFNSKFSAEYRIGAKSTEIPLQDLPLGRYVVLVRLPDLSIAITLLRNESYEGFDPINTRERLYAKTNKLNTSKKRSSNREIDENALAKAELEGKKNKINPSETLPKYSRKDPVSRDKKLAEKAIALTKLRDERAAKKAKYSNRNSRETKNEILIRKAKENTLAKNRNRQREARAKNAEALALKRSQKTLQKTDKNSSSISEYHKTNMFKSNTGRAIEGYWVVKTARGQIGTKTIRSFANEDELEELIARINLEHKIASGKHNTLKIWEIYNLAEFKKEHAKNRNYIKMSNSPYFNNVPYYSSDENLDKTP